MHSAASVAATYATTVTVLQCFEQANTLLHCYTVLASRTAHCTLLTSIQWETHLHSVNLCITTQLTLFGYIFSLLSFIFEAYHIKSKCFNNLSLFSHKYEVLSLIL